MIDSHVLVALITGITAIAVALINRGGWKRCETKLDALARHFGVKVEDSGKVVPLPLAEPAYAERKR